MALAAIPARKENRRKFEFHQITKDGFDWDGKGLVIADGDDKVFRFEEKEGQDHLCVEFYDQTKASWTKVEIKGDWPNGLDGCSATLDSKDPNRIFVFGGYDHKECDSTNDLWLFHTQTMSFKKSEVNSEKPKERSHHQAVMMGQKIVILGGWDGTEHLEDIWILLGTGGYYWERIQCIGNWPNINGESSCHATDDQTIWTLSEDDSLWKFEFANCTWTNVRWHAHELQVPKILGVGHLLLLRGKEYGKSGQLYCFNTMGHEHSQPVKFVRMTPVDTDSKNVIDCMGLDQGSCHSSCCTISKDGWMVIVKTKETEKYHLFHLKIGGEEEVQSFIDYMARIQMSEKDSDMNLVVGSCMNLPQLIPLHKIVMGKSPWIDRYTTCFFNKRALLI